MKKGAQLAFRESEPKATISNIHPAIASTTLKLSQYKQWDMKNGIWKKWEATNIRKHSSANNNGIFTCGASQTDKCHFRCGASQTDKYIEAWDRELENWTCSKLYCSWLVTNWQYVNITSSNWTLSIIEWSTFVKNWMANIPATFFVQMLLIRK